MDFTLMQVPTRVKPNSKTQFVYAPAVVTSGSNLRPGAIVQVMDVFPGDTPETTTVKVITTAGRVRHVYDNNRCPRWGTTYGNANNECECMDPIEEMSRSLRDEIFFILLTDLRK